MAFPGEPIEKLFQADCCGWIGFPNYALTTNSANIRRLERRLSRSSEGESLHLLDGMRAFRHQDAPDGDLHILVDSVADLK
jgi:hypothetical protein